jgi:hypothetical protein
MLQPATRVAWTSGDLFGRNVGVNTCPACGTVPGGRSSRYCAKHLRHLRDAWLAHRAHCPGPIEPASAQPR